MTEKEKIVLKLLDRNKKLFARWKELRDKAIEKGYKFPSTIAWIWFKDEYVQDELGNWIGA